MQRERVLRGLLVAYMLWIFYVALGPPPTGPEIPHLDKVMHALSWGLMAALCLASWPGRTGLAWVVPTMHGGATELLQGYAVVGRSAEWLDFAADLAGVAIVQGAVAYARRRRAASA